ncbi:GntR family transcriptional regulator YhfZ [Rouxiella sp. Mn2063]|uniref:GntR family transcriptional regulator YhfZ n=1 Tax=Rouxiella sp. Mn2063 TaxID=3395262 RepID=UPI003BE82110
MSRTFIKKEGIALVSLARYLLVMKEGERLRTIDEMSAEFLLSVGVVQNAMKTLEANESIKLERRGRNGTVLTQLDMAKLLQQADLGNLVCAMPLPYTKLYEGLASGLKAQFITVPLYFAHMRGAEVRINCLIEGIYDMAVVSRLAAESYLQQGNVAIALALGKCSYVDGHQLICRQGEAEQIKRVGFDPASPDQRLLNEVVFAGQQVTWVETPYSDCLRHIETHQIDAAVWNVGSATPSPQLEAHRLNGNPRYQQASEAVILVRKDNAPIQRLLTTLVDTAALLDHQQAVEQGAIEPRY